MTVSGLVPRSLPVVAAMSRHESGREWLTRLPGLIEELRERWELRLGPALHGGSCSWVAPAWRPGGSEPAVLKVTWPHREAVGEAAALRLWDGRGAVRAYAHDAERYALLLERCEPGTELCDAHGIPAAERLAQAAAVLGELWAVRPPRDQAMERLEDVTAEWAGIAEERADREWPAGIDTGLFALGAQLLRDLPRTATAEVVLHGDFNPGNVLAATRRPWLAIDAKPMTGDPAYDPWPLIEQVDDPFAGPDPAGELAHRTALVAELLEVDTWRLRAWALARRVEYTLWSVVEDGDLSRSVRLMEEARLLAGLAEL